MKKAFIFDTNFIIENVNLTEVVGNLSEEFAVYVARVSIDERLSQKYLELKKRYDRIEALKKEFADIAKIDLRLPLDEKAKREKQYTEQSYAGLFGDNIIPFQVNEDIFRQTLDRVHVKRAPFSSADGASDKGFKDTLLWISLLQFFQSNGENEIVFLTNDNGFKKNVDALCSEFEEVTGKKICINDNNYYKLLVEKKPTDIDEETVQCEAPLPDVTSLRGRIQEVIGALRGVVTENYFGDEGWERTFTLNTKLDTENVELIFSRMREIITSHLFELTVPADEVIQFGDALTLGVDIPMSALESALLLYEEIKKKLPDYMSQFYSAAASILNGNYVESKIVDEDDDDLPF